MKGINKDQTLVYQSVKPGMQLSVEKKEENFQRHNASAERGSRNATGQDTHNGTLENFEVYYA